MASDNTESADLDLQYAASELPAGYRFRPSDRELITFYLRNKVFDRPVPGGQRIVPNIHANALYSNPPDVVVSHATASSLCQRDEREWYFFLHHGCKEQDENEGEQQEEEDDDQQQQEQKQREEGHRVDLQPINRGNQIDQDFQNELDKETNEENQINEDLQMELDKEKVRVVGDGIGFWRSMGKQDPIYDADGKVYGFKVHFSYYKGCTRKYRTTHWMMDEYHVSSASSEKVNNWVLVRISRGKDYSCC